MGGTTNMKIEATPCPIFIPVSPPETKSADTAAPIKVPMRKMDAPLGAGIALLAALGGAYLVAKKRREE